jgi:hypothetical protein
MVTDTVHRLARGIASAVPGGPSGSPPGRSPGARRTPSSRVCTWSRCRGRSRGIVSTRRIYRWLLSKRVSAPGADQARLRTYGHERVALLGARSSATWPSPHTQGRSPAARSLYRKQLEDHRMAETQDPRMSKIVYVQRPEGLEPPQRV